MEVEGHQEGGVRGQCLQAGFIGFGSFDGRDGWDQIGHHVDGVDAAEEDGRCDGLHHGTIPEMHVEVGCGWELDPVEES